MDRALTTRILNVLFYFLTLYVNYLSVVYQLGGKSIRELSDKYANLFTPSNQTFGIWSLIYLLLAVFMVLQFFKRFDSQVTRNYLFLASCLFNFTWIVAWQLEYLVLSLCIMLGLLATLTAINIQLDREAGEFFKIVFGVYLGWICIATIANVTAVLVSLGWVGSVAAQVNWAIALLVIGVLLTSGVILRLRNPYLAIAVVWAFYGVSVKRELDFPQIALVAQVAMVVVGAVAVWGVFQNLRRIR
jgi:hypothetical protein